MDICHFTVLTTKLDRKLTKILIKTSNAFLIFLKKDINFYIQKLFAKINILV